MCDRLLLFLSQGKHLHGTCVCGKLRLGSHWYDVVLGAGRTGRLSTTGTTIASTGNKPIASMSYGLKHVCAAADTFSTDSIFRQCSRFQRSKPCSSWRYDDKSFVRLSAITHAKVQCAEATARSVRTCALMRFHLYAACLQETMMTLLCKPSRSKLHNTNRSMRPARYSSVVHVNRYPCQTRTHHPSSVQSLQVPLNGDLNAIKKYAQEMESIKKKVS